jgi:hypothetical protein
MAKVLEFSFTPVSLEEAKAKTAVTRTKVSQWRRVIDAFIESNEPAALMAVDNGKEFTSQAASINQQLRKADADAVEAGTIAEGEHALPVKVRAREDGVYFIRTDMEPAKK